MAYVLIIEDEPWLAESYARALLAGDFESTVVSAGQAAIELIDKRPPDIILLDIMLPGGNGVQLLHELRSYADLSSIPVVLCTSISKSLLPADLRAYGVVKILDKTVVRPPHLAQILQGVLAK